MKQSPRNNTAAHPASGASEQGAFADETRAPRPAAITLGERLVPVLLLIGEVCVGYAILLSLAVSFTFAGSANPLLPFWGLLLAVLSFYGTGKLFGRRASGSLAHFVLEPCSWLLQALTLALFFTWLNNYAPTTSLFSLGWLLALLNNLIPTIQAIVLLLLIGIAGWRGHRLVRRYVLTEDIDRLLKVGIVVLFIVITSFLLQFYVNAADPTAHVTSISPQVPALLAATFFLCVLTARALQNASYIRRLHRAKLWGSVARQEWIIGACMLLLGVAFVLIAHFLGQAAVVVSQGHLPALTKGQNSPPGGTAAGGQVHAQAASSPIPLISLLIIVISFVLFLFILVLLLRFDLFQRIAKLLKKQKRHEKKLREDESDEIHETLFNWSLFLGQILALLAHLNPFRRHSKSGELKKRDDLRLAEPMTRSIREVYRAFLKKAASRGQARTQEETPYEFWQRLRQQEMLTPGLPEVEAITETYVHVRYSGQQPGKGEVARVKQLWDELKQKWV